ncbi:DUF5677 domain-containing protein [Herbaspirillum sp. alder98]|uniref:DUF5677 domain-containing protein n=1 Tax=Herbaspirillum sp. alder98 TaxID=2913096 RepID=UPI001CD8E8CF|nr:DUF5677 domain-containing protein [Herbaspirillum sp. alder98]MCA1326218.1 DUF5677 domain-containing protein [Herbaspirillum sp. alder98]
MPKSKHRIKRRANGSIKTKKTSLRTHPLNASNIVRRRESFSVLSSEIHVPEWMAENDEIFGSLYKRYLLGKIPGYATRMPMELVREGFYIPARGFEYICDRPPEDIILGRIRQLRLGARPPLHLYRNVNPSDFVRFLCPDDVVTCLAYRRLKFDAVPCIVFAPGNEPLPFSAFETKAKIASSAHYIEMTRVIAPPLPELLESSFGLTLPSVPLDVMKKLDEKLSVVMSRLKSFHSKHETEMHYHHMLFSALIRVKETLDAVSLLVQNNLWYQALALLRVLYEIHLNFCFDWLQPETNYKYLAAAAVFTHSDIAKHRLTAAQHYVAEGMGEKLAEERAYSAWKPVSFAASVVEKAKLSKVGVHYHESIYDFLSQVSHQNFEIASLHANRFDDETFSAVKEDVKETYLRFADLIVTEFLTYVDSDIGVAAEVASI